MRRLLTLAIALVLLAVLGLSFARVTTSGAYVARSRLGRIQEGMSRERVWEVMAGVRPVVISDASHSWECWDAGGGYNVYVSFCPREAADQRVNHAFVAGPATETMLDRLLDLLGYPRGEPPGQTFAF